MAEEEKGHQDPRSKKEESAHEGDVRSKLQQRPYWDDDEEDLHDSASAPEEELYSTDGSLKRPRPWWKVWQ